MCGRIYWFPFCVLPSKLGSDFLQDNFESASDSTAKMYITCNSRGYQPFYFWILRTCIKSSCAKKEESLQRKDIKTCHLISPPFSKCSNFLSSKENLLTQWHSRYSLQHMAKVDVLVAGGKPPH